MIMNLVNLYKLIESEFDVFEKEKNAISIVPLNSEYYPEDMLKVEFNDSDKIYELQEIMRGKSIKKTFFNDEYKAVAALYIYAKNIFSSVYYDSKIDLQIERAQSLNEILEIFKKYVDKRNAPKRYSFFELKQDAIILEKAEKDGYNVFFLGENNTKKYIIESRELNSAAGVLYIFLQKLQAYYYILKKIDIQEDQYFIGQLKELYLLGYLETK